MRELKPGDVVFHLTDNEGITAISRVESEFEEFGGESLPGPPQGTPWGDPPPAYPQIGTSPIKVGAESAN